MDLSPLVIFIAAAVHLFAYPIIYAIARAMVDVASAVIISSLLALLVAVVPLTLMKVFS